jgi:hypothetical protein
MYSDPAVTGYASMDQDSDYIIMVKHKALLTTLHYKIYTLSKYLPCHIK